jgi:glyoxylase-like metal-dependent hydrolase (beta-lactamase superfamily II)
MISVHALFDKATFTLTYVVWDPVTRDAVVIDPVLDYDPATQITSDASLKKLSHFIKSEALNVHWVLETHVHADHLTSARELKTAGLAASFGVSEKMKEVFLTFAKVFSWPKSVELKRLKIDRFFKDGEEFTAGSLRLQAISTPGHTPACTTYRIGDKLFTGDALFMPDSGVGRCDFPGGSAATLYDSIWKKLYFFPEEFEIYVGHDYQPGGRPLRYRSTVGEQKRGNIHLRESTSKTDFIQFREGRDKTLSSPRLLNPSLDWNLGAHQIVKILG